MKNTKIEKRLKRKTRIRSRIEGTADRPRMSVYRSNTHISVQLIDDVARKTLVAASDSKIKKGNRQEKAKAVGEEVAKLAKAKKLSVVIFDRNGYKYHGRIKTLADAAREAGLIF
jgi:large subunit ribosomal protein L18